MISEGVKKVVKDGLKCPFCNNGLITIRIVKEPLIPFPEVFCNNCFKQVMIRYKEKPFKILEIVENCY